jgi:hypothetical protein
MIYMNTTDFGKSTKGEERIRDLWFVLPDEEIYKPFRDYSNAGLHISTIPPEVLIYFSPVSSGSICLKVIPPFRIAEKWYIKYP